ncbi:MAG TPA: hypothetical protein VLG10_10490 [Methylomirabilota bacterium]|nr:hypothetical protein [Methylomirabilota bacterium]
MPDLASAQLKMDPASLYREEVFTDRRIGTIRVLTPVKADGLTDARRPMLYVGEAQMLTPAGALPIAFEIEASSLAEAVEKFAPAAQAAVERTVRELQELRREAASSIIVPDRPIPGLGGRGGGGLIQPP